MKKDASNERGGLFSGRELFVSFRFCDRGFNKFSFWISTPIKAKETLNIIER